MTDPRIDGKVPPHDLDAEAAVLSSCLLDAAARDEAMGILEPRHFYSDANRFIFNAISELVASGEPVDVVSVASRLRDSNLIARTGGPAYLAKIVDATPAVSHVAAHAKIVWSKWRRRQLVAACHELAGFGYGTELDDVEYVAAFDQKVSALLTSGATVNEARLLRHALTDAMQQIKDAETNPQVVSTGLADLDHILGGGFRPGELIVIAGRPGQGKTAITDNITIAGATPRAAGISGWVYSASLEMSDTERAMRFLASEARADLRKLRNGELPYTRANGQEVGWDNAVVAATRLAGLPVYIADMATTMQQIASEARRLARRADQAGSRLAMVVVDYLQIMDTPRSERRELEIQKLTRGFKLLAKELRCPVVILAQLNRGVESRKPPRPMLSDLKESGAIEADADCVLMLYRQEYYEPDNDEARGLAEIIVAKQRNGPCGPVRVAFLGECTRFEDFVESGPEYHEEDWG